ncbi:unnamed protein product [Discosporangium mesarthrocarpum]
MLLDGLVNAFICHSLPSTAPHALDTFHYEVIKASPSWMPRYFRCPGLSRRASSFWNDRISSVWLQEEEWIPRYCNADESMASPQGFLLANPPGPYTCLRTWQGTSAVMLNFHLSRLRESAELMGLGDAVQEEGQINLEKRTKRTIDGVISNFVEANPGASIECMVTVLYNLSFGNKDAASGQASGGGSRIEVLAHAWPIPRGLEGGVGLEVLIAGSERVCPQAKNSNWLRERKALDLLKAKIGVQEVILSRVKPEHERGGIKRELLEGLTSNLFVVEQDGVIWTSPDGVLMGGMRKLCLDVCHSKGIDVRLEAPSLGRVSQWREAFITGTGRVLGPISAVHIPSETDPVLGISSLTSVTQSRGSMAEGKAEGFPEVLAGSAAGQSQRLTVKGRQGSDMGVCGNSLITKTARVELGSAEWGSLSLELLEDMLDLFKECTMNMV